MTGPSTKCYFSESLFMQVLTHDKNTINNDCEHFECHGLLVCVRPTSKKWFLKVVQVTMKHDSLDAM